jgi:hypothetical protein
MDLLLFTFLVGVVSVVDGKFCKEFHGKINHEFHPLRRYQKSNKTVIAVENFVTLSECAEFALQNQGLAFNFSPWGRRGRLNDTESIFLTYFSCEILDCPEFSNFSSLINDTRFDYYSLYAKNLRKYVTLCSKLNYLN